MTIRDVLSHTNPDSITLEVEDGIFEFQAWEAPTYIMDTLIKPEYEIEFDEGNGRNYIHFKGL
jgi:hypothetical protein